MYRFTYLSILFVGLFLFASCQSPVEVADQNAQVDVQEETEVQVEEVPTVAPTAETKVLKEAKVELADPTVEPTDSEIETKIVDEEPEVIQVVEAEDLSEPVDELVDESSTGEEAPMTIRLDQLPKGSELTDNHLYSLVMEWEGVNLNGEDEIYAWHISVADQTIPEKAIMATIILKSTGEPDMITESALINGTNYFYADSGCFSFPYEESNSDFTDSFSPPIKELVDVEGTLVEAGVMIDGVLTDRYSFDPLKMVPDDDPAATELEFLEASAYVAREEQYIARFHVVGRGLPTEAFQDFDVEEEGALSITIAYRPVFEPLNLAPPAGCLAETSVWSDFPQIEDAINVVETPDGLYFSIDAPQTEIETFYQTQLVAEGWIWENEATFVTGDDLLFSLEGSTVLVSMFEMGDSITVSITLE